MGGALVRKWHANRARGGAKTETIVEGSVADRGETTRCALV